MSETKKKNGKGAAAFLALWILLAVVGGVVAAEYFGLIHMSTAMKGWNKHENQSVVDTRNADY